eukprot:2458655-Prymnesium_polylepis.1
MWDPIGERRYARRRHVAVGRFSRSQCARMCASTALCVRAACPAAARLVAPGRAPVAHGTRPRRA